MPGSQACPTYSARPEEVRGPPNARSKRGDLIGRQAIRVLRAAAQQCLRIEAAGVRAEDHAVGRAVGGVARAGDAARDEREVGVAERAAEHALPVRIGRSGGQVRLRVPGRGDRRAARHAHRRRADGDAVEVRGVALREHHALASAARAADEVFVVGCAAVVARLDRHGDRVRPLVRRIRVIDARNRIDAELGGRALMAGVRRDDGEAALEAGVRKRSRVAADGRRDGAVVAAAALVEKPSAPRGRQAQFEACLVRLAVHAGAARCGAAHDAVGRLSRRSGLIGRGQRRDRRKLRGRERSAGRFARRGASTAARPMSLVTATNVSATAPANVDQSLILIARSPVRYFRA